MGNTQRSEVIVQLMYIFVREKPPMVKPVTEEFPSSIHTIGSSTRPFTLLASSRSVCTKQIHGIWVLEAFEFSQNALQAQLFYAFPRLAQ